MDVFNDIITILVFASLGIGLVKSYLVTNKIWIRKHERVVSESRSVVAALLGLVTTGPFLVKYVVLDQDLSSSVKVSVGVVLSVFYLLVGVGFWVDEGRRLSFWTLLLRSLRMERREAGDLAKAFFRPAGSRNIVRILSTLAMVDRRMTTHERNFIQEFAQTWGIDWSSDALAEPQTSTEQEASGLLIEVREAVVDYLALKPPPGQVAQLRDVIHALVSADEEISAEEKLIMAEIDGLMGGYGDRDRVRPRYEVLLVPQSPASQAAIASLLPHRSANSHAGGHAFLVDS